MVDTPKEVSDFSARLRLVIGTNSVRGFSSTCELSDAALRSYLEGNTFPTLDRLYAIASAGKVCFSWLATGEGPMRPGESVQAGIQQTQPQALAISTSDNHSLGENVELLAKIHHSGYNSLIRAISANLVAFSEAIDNKALAASTMQRMELMEVRMEKERSAWAKEREAVEQRLQSLEQRLAERDTEEPGQKKSAAA